MKRKFAWLLLPLVLCALLFAIKWRGQYLRTGVYQFAYDENGATIRQTEYIELYPNGHWKMYRLPLTSALRGPQAPLTGTYIILGQNITFRESGQSSSVRMGPGRPSPVRTARFRGDDFFIISLADHLVISQSVSNARYIKIR